MNRRLEGKVAVITGSTSGIGEATARRFAAEGASVVISGRNADKGRALVAELGGNARFHAADVQHEAEIAALLDFTVAEFGRLDCLFNNAGGSIGGTVDTVSEEQFDSAMHLLLGSVIFGIKHAARVMGKNGSGSDSSGSSNRGGGGGSIINNSSIAAWRTGQGGYLYSAAKAAVSHVTRLAGLELGPRRIRVNAISPGAIATPIFWGGSERAATLSDDANAAKLDKLKVALAHSTVLPRSGLADDIANAALFLASDEGSFVNCHDLVVDGGRTSAFWERPAT